MRHSLLLIATLLIATLLNAQTAGYQTLTDAYGALKAGQYEAAIAGFEKALTLEPGRASVHKDAAYACLKIGENRAARLHFQKAMDLDPSDVHTALEYAFLSFEAPDDPITAKAEARRVFDRVRHQNLDSQAAVTAEQAFQNIDRPLADGIARWSAALQAAAPTFSVHHEIAELAEQRDLWDLAAAHYLAAWRLEPQRKAVLIELGTRRTASWPRGTGDGRMVGRFPRRRAPLRRSSARVVALALSLCLRISQCDCARSSKSRLTS